jgi:uncharacterized protein VirK/YbjX
VLVGIVEFIKTTPNKNVSLAWNHFSERVLDEPLFVLIREHREVVRVLNHGSFRSLNQRYPELFTKYFRDYLARSLSKKSRREILKYHHQHVFEHATDLYDQILDKSVVLWSEAIDENDYAILLSCNLQFPSEGDLRLIFTYNGISLYELVFTIVPGRLINCMSDRVLLVAAVQGAAGRSEDIRKAMRLCDRAPPSCLLMTAAESIAIALKIGAVAGVSNKENLSKTGRGVPEFAFDYDAFWKGWHAERRDVGFYEIPVPFPTTPLEKVRSNQRGRVLRKRQFIAKVAADVGSSFRELFQTRLE